MPASIFEKTWDWALDAAPAALWPILSDTARLNEALGLPPYRIEERTGPNGQLERIGSRVESGEIVRWHEPMFEWVENEFWQWHRIYADGPFVEVTARLDFLPRDGGGTTLRYALIILPRNATGNALLKTGHAEKSAIELKELSAKADHFTAKPSGDFYVNLAATQKPSRPAPKPTTYPTDTEARQALEQFTRWVATAPGEDVREINPHKLATALDLSLHDAISSCLTAVEAGIVTPLLRAICPRCGSTVSEAATLAGVQNAPPCAECRTAAVSDLSKTVKVVFTLDSTDTTGTIERYCISGPGTAPRTVVRLSLNADTPQEFCLPDNATVLRARAGADSQSEAFSVVAGNGIQIEYTGGFLTINGRIAATSLLKSDTDTTLILDRDGHRSDFTPASALLLNDRFRATSAAVLKNDVAVYSGHGAILILLNERADPSRFDPVMLARHNNGAAVEAAPEGAALAFEAVEDATRAADDILKRRPDLKAGIAEGALMATSRDGSLVYIGEAAETAFGLAMRAPEGHVMRSEDPLVAS